MRILRILLEILIRMIYLSFQMMRWEMLMTLWDSYFELKLHDGLSTNQMCHHFLMPNISFDWQMKSPVVIGMRVCLQVVRQSCPREEMKREGSMPEQQI
jgi:hypothetical protein